MLPALASEQRSADGLDWRFEAPPGHPLFEGHFPGHPILPGVVALEWMLQAAERFLGRRLAATDLINLKFQAVISPGADLELTLGRKAGEHLAVSIRSAAGVHASALIPVAA
jgi:3-hydroxymyristoyl/3-hydroxydecanoyl-(acyl carrier protein) dehydratase